jgi:hypothetical protein
MSLEKGGREAAELLQPIGLARKPVVPHEVRCVP